MLNIQNHADPSHGYLPELIWLSSGGRTSCDCAYKDRTQIQTRVIWHGASERDIYVDRQTDR